MKASLRKKILPVLAVALVTAGVTLTALGLNQTSLGSVLAEGISIADRAEAAVPRRSDEVLIISDKDITVHGTWDTYLSAIAGTVVTALAGGAPALADDGGFLASHDPGASFSAYNPVTQKCQVVVSAQAFRLNDDARPSPLYFLDAALARQAPNSPSLSRSFALLHERSHCVFSQISHLTSATLRSSFTQPANIESAARYGIDAHTQFMMFYESYADVRALLLLNRLLPAQGPGIIQAIAEWRALDAAGMPDHDTTRAIASLRALSSNTSNGLVVSSGRDLHLQTLANVRAGLIIHLASKGVPLEAARGLEYEVESTFFPDPALRSPQPRLTGIVAQFPSAKGPPPT